MPLYSSFSLPFFFTDTATTEIYTLSLHDALPISRSTCRSSWITARRGSGCRARCTSRGFRTAVTRLSRTSKMTWTSARRSEEHTSELQSRLHLVCRLLLEKKKKKKQKKSDKKYKK